MPVSTSDLIMIERAGVLHRATVAELPGSTGAGELANVEDIVPSAQVFGDVFLARRGAPGSQTVEGVVLPNFISAIKTADEERVSSNSYVADAELVTPTLAANAVYRFELLLMFTGGTAEDMRFRINRTGLSDAAFRFAGDLDNNAAPTLTWLTNSNCACTGVTNFLIGNYIGVLQTGSDTGTMRIEWGQQTAGATITTMRTGSMMMLRRVA